MLAYVRARAADVTGTPDEANRRYAAALAMEPGNDILAGRALAHGVASGDEALALRAAHALPAATLPPEAKILLAADALKHRNWAEAETAIARLDGDDVFSFAAPILRAWLAFGSGKGDPIALLDAAKPEAPGALYAPEQRALILLASGRTAGGRCRAPAFAQGDRAPFRAAAHRRRLAARGAKATAPAPRRCCRATMSSCSAPARRWRRKDGSGTRSTRPRRASPISCTRIAVDLNAQQVPQVALSFGRIATFLDPGNGEAWLLTAELLDAAHEPDAALAALAHIDAGDPFADNAADRRLAILGDAGRKDEAIAFARAGTARDPQSLEAWLRLGDALTQAERYAEAGDAFGHALTLNGDGSSTGHPRWTLLLLQGNALTQAQRMAGGEGGAGGGLSARAARGGGAQLSRLFRARAAAEHSPRRRS